MHKSICCFDCVEICLFPLFPDASPIARFADFAVLVVLQTSFFCPLNNAVKVVHMKEKEEEEEKIRQVVEFIIKQERGGGISLCCAKESHIQGDTPMSLTFVRWSPRLPSAAAWQFLPGLAQHRPFRQLGA